MRTKWGPFQQFGPHEDQVLNWGPFRTHCISACDWVNAGAQPAWWHICMQWGGCRTRDKAVFSREVPGHHIMCPLPQRNLQHTAAWRMPSHMYEKLGTIWQTFRHTMSQYHRHIPLISNHSRIKPHFQKDRIFHWTQKLPNEMGPVHPLQSNRSNIYASLSSLAMY